MTSSDEKIEKHVDKVLNDLEGEASREVLVTEVGSTQRFEFRTLRWRRCIAASPFLLTALWILTASVLSLFQKHEAGQNEVSPVVIGVSIAVIALVFVSVPESVVVARPDLVLSSGIWPFKAITRVPLAAISEVRVEAFSFASWDPYVVVVTEHRRHRFAWGVPERGAREVAQAIRNALPKGG